MNDTNKSVQDYLKTPNSSIIVVVLEGSAYERGLTHGKTLKKEINEVVAIWKNHLESDYKLKADSFIEHFLKKTDFLPAIKKWTPNLFKEVLGISDGAGIDFLSKLIKKMKTVFTRGFFDGTFFKCFWVFPMSGRTRDI